MKKKTIKKIVPAKEISYTVYQCESCNTELEFPSSTRNCRICGKEVCMHCRKVINTVDDTLLYSPSNGCLSLSYDEKSYNGGLITVCKDCYEKLIAKSNVYEKCVQHFIDEFNENLAKLNDKYLKGEL